MIDAWKRGIFSSSIFFFFLSPGRVFTWRVGTRRRNLSYDGVSALLLLGRSPVTGDNTHTRVRYYACCAVNKEAIRYG